MDKVGFFVCGKIEAMKRCNTTQRSHLICLGKEYEYTTISNSVKFGYCRLLHLS